MSIEYLGLSSINGPLIALEGIQDAFYDEIVTWMTGQRKSAVLLKYTRTKL